MNHSFDVDIAKKHGVEAAVIIEHLAFWIKKNQANNKNFYDNKYWTYNSGKAFAELLPYFNDKKIRRTLLKLKDDGVLITGNYNKSPYDKTNWYSIVDKDIMAHYGLFDWTELSIDCQEVTNRVKKSDQPIPDINTNIKPSINLYEDRNSQTHNSSVTISDKNQTSYEPIFNAWNAIGFKKCRSITDKHKSAINGLMNDKYTLEEITQTIANYGMIVNSNKHYYNHQFNLLDFLKQSNACRRFIDSNPDEYLINNFSNNASHQKPKFHQEAIDRSNELGY